MIADRQRPAGLVLLLLAAHTLCAAEIRVHQGTNIAADVHPESGRIVMDLLDGLWRVPARGGDARRLTPAATRATRPRWSPDGNEILFEQGSRRQLHIMDADGEALRRVSPADRLEQMADWHPDGGRIVFASPTVGSGLDIWERDLATGLHWRVTRHAGDETDPAWSSDGRHLSYVLHEEGRWYLMLKPFAKPARVLDESVSPVYAPSWRPDGTLITYLANGEDGSLQVRMTILAEPPLTRTLLDDEDFFIAPVSWLDRQRMLYTADGVIKTRGFEDRKARTLPFSAAIGTPRSRDRLRARGRLPDGEEAKGTLTIRASRLFDGRGTGYRHNVDVVIRDGRIASVGPAGAATDGTVIDIGNVSVLPGLIDVYAGLPDELTPALATELLAAGITTIVSPRPDGQGRWPDSTGPAPRLLRAANAGERAGDAAHVGLVSLIGDTAAGRRALENWRRRGIPLLAGNWRSGLAAGADLTLGSAEMPASPGGHRYQDLKTLMQGGPLTLVSALADAATPGLAGRLPPGGIVVRRHARAPVLANGETRVVVGSLPSELPPGLATQAELLALHAAGLAPAATLTAATADAASAIGFADEIGRIVPGARADLVLVAGDPLASIADAAQVVAVVINGRFHSIAGLRDATQRVD